MELNKDISREILNSEGFSSLPKDIQELFITESTEPTSSNNAIDQS